MGRSVDLRARSGNLHVMLDCWPGRCWTRTIGRQDHVELRGNQVGAHVGCSRPWPCIHAQLSCHTCGKQCANFPLRQVPPSTSVIALLLRSDRAMVEWCEVASVSSGAAVEPDSAARVEGDAVGQSGVEHMVCQRATSESHHLVPKRASIARVTAQSYVKTWRIVLLWSTSAMQASTKLVGSP